MKPLRSQIFGHDPYEGFDLSLAEPDLQGWGSEHPLFDFVIETLKPSLLVEVGTWKGASAIYMADKCLKAGLDSEIICVDTWLGAASSLTHGVSKSQSDRFESLKMKNGWPMLYFTFMRNVIESGRQDIITPLAQTSDNAAKILKFYGVQADVIYVDAAHQAGPVYRDLLTYWRLLRPGGVLIGDDRTRRGVSEGVDRFIFKTGEKALACGRKYIIMKGIGPENLTLGPGQKEIAAFAKAYKERS